MLLCILLWKILERSDFFFKFTKLAGFDKFLIDKHLTKCYSFVKELTTMVPIKNVSVILSNCSGGNKNGTEYESSSSD